VVLRVPCNSLSDMVLASGSCKREGCHVGQLTFGMWCVGACGVWGFARPKIIKVAVAESARKARGAGAGCHCERQLADEEMVICDKCECSAHIECVRATVTAGRWRCARCSKPKVSKKRPLDDGARGLAQARNAEEARAAKKKARKEKEKETRVLAKKLADQGLCTVEIPADGHCLFSAVSDQLKRTVGGLLRVCGVAFVYSSVGWVVSVCVRVCM
jgi:hypothetical protein